MISYITKCPYCKKIIRKEWGVEKFYDYKDKKNVTIGHHNNCGSFIQIPIEDISYNRYDIPQDFQKRYLRYIEECVLEQLNKPKLPTEKEMLHQVVDYLKSIDGGKNNYSDISANWDNIKIIIEIIVGQVNLNDIYTEPLTKEVKKEIIFRHAACFD